MSASGIGLILSGLVRSVNLFSDLVLAFSTYRSMSTLSDGRMRPMARCSRVKRLAVWVLLFGKMCPVVGRWRGLLSDHCDPGRNVLY